MTRTTTMRFVDLLAILVLVGGGTYFVAAKAMSSPALTELRADAAFVRLARGGSLVGSETAPVTVVVFSDYECSYCRELQASVEKLLLRYPQHVAFSFRHFVPGRSQSRLRNAMGAECAADQGLFWEYHRAAFRDYRVLSHHDGWLSLGESLGVLDGDEFRRCVLDGDAIARLQLDMDAAEEWGVRATPSLVIGGRLFVGTPDVRALDQLIAAEMPRHR